MNSRDKSAEQLQMDQMLKRARQAAKRQELKKRKAVLTLPRSDEYVFEFFQDGGDSGLMYLGTSKLDGSKHIIKHAYADCACNEFIFYSIGTLLGCRIPHTHLILPSPTGGRDLFETEYVAGISYLESAEPLKSLEALREPHLIDQWLTSQAISVMLGDEDCMEHLVAEGNLYRVDTANSFRMGQMIPIFLGAVSTPMQKEAHAQMLGMIKSAIENEQARTTTDFHELLEEQCQKWGTVFLPTFLTTFQRVESLVVSDILPALDTLCQVYPDALAEYYLGYFVALQERVGRFLLERA